MLIRFSDPTGRYLFGNVFVKEAFIFNNGIGIASIEGTPEFLEWEEILPKEYLSYFKSGIVSVDKNAIAADGIDMARITVEVAEGIEEVIFYDIETDKIITKRPVEPGSNIATLEITATTPGLIKLRVGDQSATQLNEVIIYAIEAN